MLGAHISLLRTPSRVYLGGPYRKHREDHAMTLLNFGQPLKGIVQFAYVVADLERAMADYTARLNIGPWFVIGPFSPPEARYRGQPTKLNVTLAIGYSGHMQIELIQQHNDAPS